jgi:hypothetical protein
MTIRQNVGAAGKVVEFKGKPKLGVAKTEEITIDEPSRDRKSRTTVTLRYNCRLLF